ncbi:MULTISPECIES: ABC transporter permease [Dictyoglomus]|jgi:NitT/TauT family transport system permease protein|uniref:Binding-protein-dependent transport systems inner membrane component n=1 Tax=Dictyoglomus turgidum (strain DSM 6724 / Z-1310) TaxID=515635 RepID=B8DZW8_DICTD|nr:MULTISPECIES: ABC transporter permease subunit [Dictyoglomus]ACK42051.1 binding-protein-dependent transport systems inner membrane component [Dictyoglomus turgidum DSM 6724]PNV80008.1 MAG: ABC transporter permease [Dictyoglomus turgidum]HBU31388.1 ABC transporter permease [Dictyoglomus sp.]
MSRVIWSPVKYRRFSFGDIIILLFIGSIIYAISSLNTIYSKPTEIISLDLSPQKLPLYSLFSLLRMIFAYFISLVFTIVYAYTAAYKKSLEKILIPLLDILQSIPVLSFLPPVFMAVIAMFPGSKLGLEITSIILIFTGQVWNMVFSFYQSLISIPKDLREAASLLKLNPWQRFWYLELPYAAIGLIWNSMMSWAGGWFFLMACEMFTLTNQNFVLPGLGSYLSFAALKGDLLKIFYGLFALITVIVLLDQLVWRPLLAWSQKFKVEYVQAEGYYSSRVLLWYRRSRIFDFLYKKVIFPLREKLENFFVLYYNKRGTQEGKASIVSKLFITLISLITIALVLRGFIGLLRLIITLPLPMWKNIIYSALLTLLRVTTAVLIALSWTLPLGVRIGMNPKLSRLIQPVVQIVASVPATAIFPVIVMYLINLPGGLNIASIILMLLGTQWYLLFNTIAGGMSIPNDLIEISALLKLSKIDRWRILILPSILPFVVTGGITAMGGAFNASIVSEYIEFQNQIYKIKGLGALITEASSKGDNALLAASTLVMAIMVVTINRLFWKRLFKKSEELLS